MLSAGLVCGGWTLQGSAQQASREATAKAELPDSPDPGFESTASEAGQNAGAQAKPGIERGTAIISGTVLDTNDDVIQGARVKLINRAGAEEEIISGSNGEFAFSALAPGSYRVTVSGSGMGTFVSAWLAMHAGDMRIVSHVVLPIAAATTSITVSGNNEELKQELAEHQVEIAEEQRVWGVFPNFYSSYDWNAPPLGTKQKYKLAFRSMMDPVAFAGAGGLAGFEQFYNIFPGYGGGIEGYAKRYGAAYANDFSARMLSSAVFASMFRQDPRYFYRGTGSTYSRALYAMSAAVIARTDDGRWRPNYSHVLGTFAAGALSNLYYPKASRGVSLTLVNSAVEVAGNAGTNLIREFVLKGITKHAGGQP